MFGVLIKHTVEVAPSEELKFALLALAGAIALHAVVTFLLALRKD